MGSEVDGWIGREGWGWGRLPPGMVASDLMAADVYCVTQEVLTGPLSARFLLQTQRLGYSTTALARNGKHIHYLA